MQGKLQYNFIWYCVVTEWGLRAFTNFDPRLLLEGLCLGGLGIGEVCGLNPTVMSVQVSLNVLSANKPIECCGEAFAIEMASVCVRKTMCEVIWAFSFGETCHASEYSRLLVIVLSDRLVWTERPLICGHDWRDFGLTIASGQHVFRGLPCDAVDGDDIGAQVDSGISFGEFQELDDLLFVSG